MQAIVDEATSVALERIVEQLIGTLEPPQTVPGQPTPLMTLDGDVLLDVEVDGLRCVVVRRRQAEPGGARVALSPREREIARMVSQGYTNKTIAAVLEISLWTVSTHLRRIFAKLGVSNRAAMVALLAGHRREVT